MKTYNFVRKRMIFFNIMLFTMLNLGFIQKTDFNKYPEYNNFSSIFQKYYNSHIKSTELKILKKYKNKNIIRMVNFTDYVDKKLLIKESNGLKTKSAYLVKLPNTNNVDSINNFVFPVFPTEVVWLCQTDTNRFDYYIFDTFKKQLTKKEITLPESGFEQIIEQNYKSYYLYNINTDMNNYITLITIRNMNDIKSFWVQGFTNAYCNYLANDPKDSSKGFKKTIFTNVYSELKEHYKFDDYNPMIIKLSFLNAILIGKHLDTDISIFLNQFTRDF